MLLARLSADVQKMPYFFAALLSLLMWVNSCKQFAYPHVPLPCLHMMMVWCAFRVVLGGKRNYSL